MAAYPTTPPRKTGRAVISQQRARVMDNGEARIQDLADKPAYTLTVAHKWITDAELQSLQQFRQANEADVNTIVVRTVTYNFRFKSDYRVLDRNGSLSSVVVELYAWIP